jgi:2-keto-4-pentenoate hydratase/2-oxohepta-3-ene-1,7-dioic acid hydratase in catechol pathway
MRLVTFVLKGGIPTPGVLSEKGVHSLGSAPWPSLLALLQAGEDALGDAAQTVKTKPAQPLDEVQLLAPLPSPPRIFGIGLNYAEHAAESQMAVQKVPTVFLKLSSSVVGPGAEVVLPRNATQPDYEAELGVVIGKPGYRIPADQWEQHVFGYTIVNDISARDVQLATSQWTLGKSFPTFTPLGPSIVTRDEVPDPHALSIKLAIDGEVLQDANTQQLIFRVPELIAYISSITPLEAGDIISTGTPQGVGLGRTPQRWLQPGEEMVITIERLGELRNRTRAEN